MATLTPPPVVGQPCTSCGSALVTEKGAVPWCAKCGWNLNYFDTDRRRPEIGWRWVDRMTFRMAYDLNAGEFSTLAGRPMERIGFSWIKALMTALSLALLVMTLAVAALGLWLIVDLNNFGGYLIGGLLLCVAGSLRPRFGKLGKHADPISESDAPSLHRLVREVAAASGAPMPHQVLWTTQFNASSWAYGMRRRRVLSIGLPLWISLTPQQRVALLGHELGHFVNGDVRRGPLTGVAFRTFGTLAQITRPVRRRGGGFMDLIAQMMLGLIHSIFAATQVCIDAIAVRATHRAEYAADQISSSVAGSGAASTLLDTLLFREAHLVTMRRSAREDPDPQAWRKAVAESADAMSPRLPLLRQLSMREQASLFRTHPPTGLRAQMAASRPSLAPKVVLTESDAVRIDQELAPQYRTVRHTLIN